jgi:hypothetical protein
VAPWEGGGPQVLKRLRREVDIANLISRLMKLGSIHPLLHLLGVVLNYMRPETALLTLHDSKKAAVTLSGGQCNASRRMQLNIK